MNHPWRQCADSKPETTFVACRVVEVSRARNRCFYARREPRREEASMMMSECRLAGWLGTWAGGRQKTAGAAQTTIPEFPMDWRTPRGNSKQADRFDSSRLVKDKPHKAAERGGECGANGCPRWAVGHCLSPQNFHNQEMEHSRCFKMQSRDRDRGFRVVARCQDDLHPKKEHPGTSAPAC
jgi:hypothetical protein